MRKLLCECGTCKLCKGRERSRENRVKDEEARRLKREEAKGYKFPRYDWDRT